MTKVRASEIKIGDRVLVTRLREVSSAKSIAWYGKNGNEIVVSHKVTTSEVVLVTGVSSHLQRSSTAYAGRRTHSVRVYNFETAEGTLAVVAHGTVSLAGNSPTEIKRAMAQALAEDANRNRPILDATHLNLIPVETDQMYFTKRA